MLLPRMLSGKVSLAPQPVPSNNKKAKTGCFTNNVPPRRIHDARSYHIMEKYIIAILPYLHGQFSQETTFCTSTTTNKIHTHTHTHTHTHNKCILVSIGLLQGKRVATTHIYGPDRILKQNKNSTKIHFEKRWLKINLGVHSMLESTKTHLRQ